MLFSLQPGGGNCGDATETDGDGDDTTPAGSGGEGVAGLGGRGLSARDAGGGIDGSSRTTRQQQHNKEAQKRYR